MVNKDAVSHFKHEFAPKKVYKKKPYMDKTLRNGLIMSETNPLNHKWLDFGI